MKQQKNFFVGESGVHFHMHVGNVQIYEERSVLQSDYKRVAGTTGEEIETRYNKKKQLIYGITF